MLEVSAKRRMIEAKRVKSLRHGGDPARAPLSGTPRPPRTPVIPSPFPAFSPFFPHPPLLEMKISEEYLHTQLANQHRPKEWFPSQLRGGPIHPRS